MAFSQVSGYTVGIGAEHCKTVGSAYVGSNPTPAITCENGPLAAETRPGGPFPSCPAVYQGVSLRVDVLRCPRTYSGWRPCHQDGRCAPSAFHGRPRTGPRGAHPGFVCSAEPGARARTRAAAGGARCARREAGSLRSDLLPGWRLVDGRISGNSRAQGGWRRGPSGRAAGSVAARHANCRSAGGAARCGGRRAARGAYGRPCRIRALAGLPGYNSDVPADGLRVPGSAVCSAWVPGELAARV